MSEILDATLAYLRYTKSQEEAKLDMEKYGYSRQEIDRETMCRLCSCIPPFDEECPVHGLRSKYRFLEYSEYERKRQIQMELDRKMQLALQLAEIRAEQERIRSMGGQAANTTGGLLGASMVSGGLSDPSAAQNVQSNYVNELRNAYTTVSPQQFYQYVTYAPSQSMSTFAPAMLGSPFVFTQPKQAEPPPIQEPQERTRKIVLQEEN